MNNNKVVHFSDESNCNDINQFIKENNNVLYYTRIIPEKNEFHIVKTSDRGEIEITQLITQLFKFYEKDQSYSKLLTDTKVKGNDNFAIIVNSTKNLNEKLRKDLNILLKK